jgi:hypothetical protein
MDHALLAVITTQWLAVPQYPLIQFFGTSILLIELVIMS